MTRRRILWEGGTNSICDSREDTYFTLCCIIGDVLFNNIHVLCLGWSLDADDLRLRGVKDCTITGMYRPKVWVSIGWARLGTDKCMKWALVNRSNPAGLGLP